MSATPKWFEEVIKEVPQSRYIEVDGIKIHYLVWGNQDKPGLFLIHGYSAHAHWWDFIAPSFIEDYCVVAIDLSGMGDSDHRQFYSQDLYGEEIKAVVDDMNWESADFLAHSMSGPISIKTASNYPHIFKSLFILDSIIVVPPDKTRTFSGRSSMIRTDFIYEDLEKAVESFRLIPPQPTRNEFILKHIAANSFKEIEEGWVLKSDGSIMKTYQYEDLTDIFMNLKCSIYLVYGLMSQIFSQEILEYTKYVGNLSEESVVGIPGAMHHLFIDEPIAFIQEIKRLLETGVN